MDFSDAPALTITSMLVDEGVRPRGVRPGHSSMLPLLSNANPCRGNNIVDRTEGAILGNAKGRYDPRQCWL